MEALPMPIRFAQATGLTSSLLLSGISLSLSTMVIPRILESPAPLALKQWAHMYALGKSTALPLVATSALSYFYLVAHYLKPQYFTPEAYGAKAKLYAAAGLLCLGIVPYTVLVIKGTNDKLFAKAATVGYGVSGGDKGGDWKGEEGEREVGTYVETGVGEETAHRLVDWWGVLNLGRSAMTLVGGLIGVYAVVN